MTTGEEKLKRAMDAAGWRGVRVWPLGHGLKGDDKIEATGVDPAGDIGIHVDAGPDGHPEGFAVSREGTGDGSGWISYSRGVPTPEEAMGVWEELNAGEANRGLR